MLINLSSTPYASWSEEQSKQAINEFENIVDLDLPYIDAQLDDLAIKLIADPIIDKCVDYFNNADLNNAICLSADPVFTFYMVKSVLERGFRCVAPSFDESNGSNKTAFVRFREFKLKY